MASTVTADLDYRPSYLAAGIASVLVLLLYVVTLAPSTAMWDTSEYIAAAYILGSPHPPGNPFFVLIGRFFSLLPIAGSRGGARQHAGGGLERRVRRHVVPDHRARAGELVPAALAAHRRRRARRAHRRDGVHGVEPVGREREGVHGQPRRPRARRVAYGALVRRARRPEGRPHSRARRLPARPRLREPHGRHARRAGGRDRRR